MKKYKQIIYLVLALLILGGTACFIFLGNIGNSGDDEESSTAFQEAVMETYSFREIEGMMLFLAGDNEDMRESLEHLIDPLSLSNPVNAGYIMEVSKVLGMDDGIYTDLLFGTEMDSAISRKQFDMFYQRVLDSGKIAGLERATVYLREVVNETTVSDGYQEYKIGEVVINPKYLGQIVTVYRMQDVIFKIASISSEKLTYKAVWCGGIVDNTIYFYKDGKLDCMQLGDYSTAENMEGSIIDIVFDNNGVCAINETQTIIKNVTHLDDGKIELNGVSYEISEDFGIYNVSSMTRNIDEYLEREEFGADYRSIDGTPQMLLNSRMSEVVMEDGKIRTIYLSEDNLRATDIHVLIRALENDSVFHEKVTVSCKSNFAVSTGGRTKEYVAGARIDLTAKEIQKGIVRVRALNSDDSIICTIWGTKGAVLECPGVLLVRGEEEGLVLVNSFSTEKYIVNVLAGMLSENEPSEAAESKAVVIRTNAISAISSPKYPQYGASVDDSLYDYRFKDEEKKAAAYAAVIQTYGEVLVYKNKPISAYYYMTSAGVTNSNSDLWEEEEASYYSPHYETNAMGIADLSTEMAIDRFLENSKGLTTLEKDEPFYRWRVEFTWDELSKVVNEKLVGISETETGEDSGDDSENSEISDNGSHDDKSHGGEGEEEAGKLAIGELQGLEITRRGKGGCVLEVRIVGSDREAHLTGQSNIRSVFSPSESGILLNDGSRREGWEALPSTTFNVKVEDEKVIFLGGGFGSGVGLSQRGAVILAEEGCVKTEILAHYYPGCSIKDYYALN